MSFLFFILGAVFVAIGMPILSCLGEMILNYNELIKSKMAVKIEKNNLEMSKYISERTISSPKWEECEFDPSDLDNEY